MNDFDWTYKIEPSVFMGMKFTIPTNSSLNGVNRVVEITDVSVVFWCQEIGNVSVSKDFANENVKTGVWKVVKDIQYKLWD